MSQSQDRPARRSTDRATHRFWFAPKENAYRDVWLFLITLIALAGVLKAVNTANIVKSQRHNTILQACRDENHRHDETIRRLRQLATGSPHAERNLKATIFLIDAFEPKRNCPAVVHKQAP